MSRERGSGSFDRFVIWLLAFAFFGPALAVRLTDSIDDVIVTLAPYATVLVVAALVIFTVRNR